MKRQNEKKIQKPNIYILLRWLLIVSIIIVTPIFIYEGYKLKVAREEYNSIPDLINTPSTDNMPITTGKPETWPENELFVEANRAKYRTGDLRLQIPSISVDETVMDGTSQAALKHGPGLYEYSQMPGEGNRNVSIAGHRAGYSKYYNLFRNLHKLKEGDLLYLSDKNKIYTYQYKETKIISPEDRSVIYLQGFSCLTLTSCHPIGENKQRIIVTATLMTIDPFTLTFEYAPHVNNE